MKTAFLFVLFLFAISACHKENSVSEGLYHTWEAKEFMSIESVAYPKNGNTKVLLTFQSIGKYQLKLDVNSCGGDFSVEKNNQLEIGATACTEACCDSKFAEKVAAMLSRVATYEISGKTMKLNVPHWGYIQLELAE